MSAEQQYSKAKDLDLTAIEFYSQAKYFSDTCGFKQRWVDGNFKQQFGKAPDKDTQQTMPQLPGGVFLTWLAGVSAGYRHSIQLNAVFNETLNASIKTDEFQ